MKIFKEQHKIIFMAIISLIILYYIFKTIVYLSSNGYVYVSYIENFTDTQFTTESDKTSHTVNLPLTTTQSCSNFCGPTSRCAISGQQCFADIDCSGCQPKSKQQPYASGSVPGDDDAGKLSFGAISAYSPLTSGYGTKELIITNDLYGKLSSADFGINSWKKSFNTSQQLFNQRYKPPQTSTMPNYPQMYSLSGEFKGDGPLPSNY